jgi:hypothetical protein
VLEHYIDHIENFLVHFISGSPRGVDELIRGLEHPEAQFKTDEKLLKQIRRLAAELKSADIPDVTERQYYKDLVERFKSLNPNLHLDEFIGPFKELLIQATKYEKSDIAVLVKRNSIEATPHVMELRNYRTAMNIWKLILNRLTEDRPLEGIDEFEKKLAARQKMNVDTFRKETGLWLDKEDEAWHNWKGDQQKDREGFWHIANSKKENFILFRLLRECGQKDYAGEILIQTLKEGREKFIDKLRKLIQHLFSGPELHKVKVNAISEMIGLISKMLEKMDDALRKEKDKFAKVITARIGEIEKEHAKDVKEFEERRDRMEELSKKTLLAATLGADDYDNIAALDKSSDDLFVRAWDIIRVFKARLALSKWETRMIDTTQLNSELNAIIATGPSEFTVRAIESMKELHEKRTKEEITMEQYETSMKGVDDFIDKLMEQIPMITSRLRNVSDRRWKLVEEFEDLKFRSQREFDRAYDYADESSRRMRKRLHKEEYYPDLSPDEREWWDEAA